MSNYPKVKKLNTRNEWIERGSFHIRVKEWELDLRGIQYCLCRGRVWILLPNKKGIIDGKECEFPIINFRDKEKQRAFIKLLQRCFSGFMKSHFYVPFDQLEKQERRRKMRKERVFVTPPPRRKYGT